MRFLRAFLVRDFYTETSYRVAFVVGIGGVLFRAFIFYFLSQLIGDSTAPLLQEFNGDYFSYVIIGIAFGSYFGVGLNSFARALRQAQTTGTLEALMMTPALTASKHGRRPRPLLQPQGTDGEVRENAQP